MRNLALRAPRILKVIGFLLAAICLAACLITQPAVPSSTPQALTPVSATHPNQPVEKQAAVSTPTQPSNASSSPTSAPRGGGDGFACFIFSVYNSGITCLTNSGWQAYKQSVTFINIQGRPTKPVYGHDSPLGDGNIETMSACPDGSLVILTTDDLFRFDGSTFTPIASEKAGETIPVRPLTCGLHGKIAGEIWIDGVLNLMMYDGSAWSYHPIGSLEDGLADIDIAPDGRVWVTDNDEGVAVFDGSTWTNIQPAFTKEEAAPHSVNIDYGEVAIDRRGRVWVLVSGRLAAVDGGKLVLVNTSAPSRELVFDGQDRLWADFSDAPGFYSLKDGQQTVYTQSEEGLPYNFVSTLSIDANDRVWVGTKWGLGVLDGGQWTTYNMSNSDMLDNQIDQLAVVGSGPNLPAPESYPEGAIAGQIFHKDKTPLVDAVVEVCVVELLETYRSDRTPCAGQPFIARGRTDDQGSFKIDNLPRGYYVLTFDTGDGWSKYDMGLASVDDRVLVSPGETADVGKLYLLR